MKATKAYIASLGTTGVLLGASILMLAVVSAVVAFDRWPTGNVSTRVQTLVLSDKPAPIRVSATASGVTGAAAVARATTGGVAVPRALRNGDGVAGQRIAAGRPAAPSTPAGPLPIVAPAVPKALQPVTDQSQQIIYTISNPSTATTQVADGAQSVTDAAGVSVGRVSPQVGDAVAGAGQAAAQAVREVPLPDHVLPGS
jgi:hypothetical protein